MFELDYNQKYLEALVSLKSGRTNEDVIVGSVLDFSEEELSKMSDYLILNNNVIITSSSGETHDIAKNVLIREIIKSIQSISNENLEKYDSLLEYSVPYVDVFECGRIIDKHADSLIIDETQNPRSFPLVMEIAHGSESYKTLIIELLNYLSEFTNTIYAVGFFIDRESEYFKASLIILRRKLPIDKTKIDAFLEAINKKDKKRHFEIACPKEGKKQIPRMIIDMNKFIFDNNAQIFFEYEINNTNLDDSVEFRLRADDFNGEEGKFINIVISSKTVKRIFTRWKEWRYGKY